MVVVVVVVVVVVAEACSQRGETRGMIEVEVVVDAFSE